MMSVYKVTIALNHNHPLLFVVDSIAEIERLYKKHYPDGNEIISIELVEGQVINEWAQ